MTHCRTQTNLTASSTSYEVNGERCMRSSVEAVLRTALPVVLLVGAFVCTTGCRAWSPDYRAARSWSGDFIAEGRKHPVFGALAPKEDDVLVRGARYSEAGRRRADAARELSEEKKYPEALSGGAGFQQFCSESDPRDPCTSWKF